MESALRERIRRPWWSASEQNEQPPAHPRCVVTLNCTISTAGIGSRYDGCGWRVNGKA
jgi:hypothetical protein